MQEMCSYYVEVLFVMYMSCLVCNTQSGSSLHTFQNIVDIVLSESCGVFFLFFQSDGFFVMIFL